MNQLKTCLIALFLGLAGVFMWKGFRDAHRRPDLWFVHTPQMYAPVFYCADCGKYFEADGVTETTAAALVIPMLECPHPGLALRDAFPGTFYDTPQHSGGAWAPSIRFYKGLYYIYYQSVALFYHLYQRIILFYYSLYLEDYYRM